MVYKQLKRLEGFMGIYFYLINTGFQIFESVLHNNRIFMFGLGSFLSWFPILYIKFN